MNTPLDYLRKLIPENGKVGIIYREARRSGKRLYKFVVIADNEIRDVSGSIARALDLPKGHFEGVQGGIWTNDPQQPIAELGNVLYPTAPRPWQSVNPYKV